VNARTAEVAAMLGIAHLLEREIGALSAGEACLVAIGAALVSRPVLLIVDEPLSDLDTVARVRVVGVLDRLAHQAGVCVVVAEHALRDWDGIVDHRFELRDGLVRPQEDRVTDPTAGRPVRLTPGSEEVVAAVRHLSVMKGRRMAVDDVSFSLLAGEITAVRGANGAGKSSLLHAMARPTDRGRIFVRGVDVRALHRAERRRSVALVPEEFDDLLFTTTVAEECRRADRRADRRAAASRRGVSPAATTFLSFLGVDDVDGSRRLLARHPRDLSAGERLCLVIAIQLSAGPSALLVDEPTRGLDACARSLVGDALRGAADAGAAVLLATHDLEFAERYADRTLTMTAGRLHEFAEVSR
jgi:energy-coupling factor transport system ATP-binding protein